MACVIGKYCEDHVCVHGGEAEELRRGIEKILEALSPYCVDGEMLAKSLQKLLDDVDARDSLVIVEGPTTNCLGKTASGSTCRNRVAAPNIYCYAHR
jgi:hypothetical protein